MAGLSRYWALPAAALLLAGCGEDGPVAPVGGTGVGAEANILACQVDVRGGGITCTGEDEGLGDGAQGAIIGGQGIYVELSSTNVGYDAGSEVFSADVAIRNMVNQVIGTSDGVTIHPDGIRIFFVSDPSTDQGSGSVSVRNADGTGSFSGSGQPYFQYSQALAPGRTSLPRTWEWNVPSTVEKFSFNVGVSAELPDEANHAPGIDFVSQTISTDSLHGCAIDITGQVWCWGFGGHGRLGNASTDDQPVPGRVEHGLNRFVTVSAGLNFTCGLTDTGKAFCWGYGASGRLGNGTTSNSTVPAPVLGEHTFRQIGTGRQFACGLTIEGKAFCWGNNTNGHLGSGDFENRSEPNEVVGGHTFASIAVGGFHACGLEPSGQAWCWGSGSNGKLGNGETTGAFTEPTAVVGGHVFTSIYARQQHTCGLKADGQAWCWGGQNNGRLGNGETAGSVSVPEPFPVVTDERFVSLALGINHSCGITAEGKAHCWGSNGRGKRGTGNTTGTTGVPEPVIAVENFAQMSAGADHTCGITTTGEVYCWGNGADYRLGVGTTDTLSTPTLVTGIGPIAFLNDAADSGATGPDADAWFPRRSLEEQLILAARSAKPVITNLI